MGAGSSVSRGFRVALGTLVLAHLLWPGHARWLGDQPLLIMNAWAANLHGELAPRGLIGTVGFHYGGLPTWIYQALLWVTPDLVVITAIKNGVFLAVYAVCLTWFVRVLQLSPWPALWLLVAPAVHDYDRVLWDNVWQWPLSLVAVMCLVRFWRDGTPRALYGAAVASAGLVLTHLMSGLLLASVLVTMVVCDRAVLRQRWRHLLGASALGGVLVGPYLWSAIARFDPEPLAAVAATPPVNPLWEAWRSLSAIRVFSANAPATFFPELLQPGPQQLWALSTQLVSAMLVPMWFVAAFAALRHLRARFAAGEVGVVERLLVLGLTAPWVSALAILALGVPYQPHYIGSTWFPYLFVLWWWIDRAIEQRSDLVLRVAKLQAVAAACGFALYLAHLHHNRGNQSIQYGPALSVQIDAARKVAGEPASSRVVLDAVPLYRFDPFAFRSLLKLQVARRGAVEGPPKLLVVQPAGGDRLGELRVAEARRR